MTGELEAVAPSYPGLSFSCSQLELGEDLVRVAARADHPLFARPALELHDLAEHAWVMPSRHSSSRRLLTQILERAGMPAPRVAMEAEYISSAVMGVVAGTDLLAAVPVSVLQAWVGRVHALPLLALEIRRTLVMLTRVQAAWTPLTVEFCDGLIARRAPRCERPLKAARAGSAEFPPVRQNHGLRNGPREIGRYSAPWLPAIPAHACTSHCPDRR